MSYKLKKIDATYVDNVWQIMQKCYIKDLYRSHYYNKDFFRKILAQGWCIGAFDKNELIGFSLARFNETKPILLLAKVWRMPVLHAF